MIPAILIKWLGERLAGPVLVGGAIAILLIAILLLSHCRADPAAEQAAQTSRSAEAVANAGQFALRTYANSVANEARSAASLDASNKEIANAQDRDTQRRILLERLCASAGHRHDPACVVPSAHP